MISDLSSLFSFPFFLFWSWSIIDSDTIESSFDRLIPLIPFEDLPLKTLNFFESNLIHLPFWVLKIISWSSLHIFTPTILSFISSFIAIFPEAFIDEKSSKLFFLTFPLAVAKTIQRFFHSDSLSGNGIIELIDWWFFRGKILNKDLPFEDADPSGIFQALIL